MINQQKDETSEPDVAQVDRKLLEILVCPLTKGPLSYNADTQELISLRADVAYPIRKGVPLMTPEAARPLSDQERAKHSSSRHKS